MIIITSLSPNHKQHENQQVAIDSWQQFGRCFSMNSSAEIMLLNYKGIEFIETTKTMQHLFIKPLVAIYAIIEQAMKLGDDLLITNSDIIFKGLPEFKTDGITILSRNDYLEDINTSKKFENGFDVFFIPAKFLHLFPLSIYALGACWHDFYTPMTAINNNVPVYSYHHKFTFHKFHPVQYPVQEYYDIGEYFRWEFKFNKKLQAPQVAAQALSFIKSKIIYL